MIFIDMQLGAISTVQSMDQQELKRNALALAKVCTILPTARHYLIGRY